MNIQGDLAKVCKKLIQKPEDGLLAYFGQISAFECTDNLRLTAGPSQPPPTSPSPRAAAPIAVCTIGSLAECAEIWLGADDVAPPLLV